MSFQIIFFSSLSYFAIIGSGYILFYGMFSFKFENNKTKIYYEIIIGFVLGILTIFATLAATSISKTQDSKNAFLIWPIIIVIASGIFISPFVMYSLIFVDIFFTFAFPHFIKNFLFEAPTSKETFILCSFYLIAAILIPLIDLLYKKGSKSIKFFYISSGIFFIILFFSILNLSDIRIFKMVAVLNWYIYNIFVFFISFITDKIHNHAITLSKINEINNDYFVSSEVLRNKIKNHMKENKIKKAFLFTFLINEYDMLDKLTSPSIRDFIWNHISDETQNKMLEKNKNSFFFLTNYKMNTILVPIEDDLTSNQVEKSYQGNNEKERAAKDYLKKYEALFKNIAKDFLIDDYKISVKLKVVSSILGIHSNNYEKLVSNNISLLNNSEKLIDKNFLYLLDPKEQNDFEYENRKLKILNSLVTATNASNLYEKIYDIKNHEIIGSFINYILDGNIIFPLNKNDEQIKIVNEYGLYSYLIRFLAFKGLKEISKSLIKNNKKENNIFINYDAKFVASLSFSSIEFLNKIKKLNVPKKIIVLTFDINTSIENYELLNENITNLKANGIRISVMNLKPTQEHLSILPYYQPDFAILDYEFTDAIKVSKENKEIIQSIVKICNKIECKVIAQNVKFYIFYKTLQSLGIDGIFGELIGSSTQMKYDITKEQKILLNK